MFQLTVVEHGVGQHVAADGAATPAHQVDPGRDHAVLAEGFDQLFLQLLLGHAAVAVIVFAPHPRTGHGHVFDRNSGRFEAVIFRFGELLALPFALAFENAQRVLHVLLPAFAEQAAGHAVFLVLHEHFIGLQVAAAGPIHDDPFSKLTACAVGRQRRNQLAIPVVLVGGVELGGAGAAEVNSYCSHGKSLRSLERTQGNYRTVPASEGDLAAMGMLSLAV